jgi:hypothetical protein
MPEQAGAMVASDDDLVKVDLTCAGDASRHTGVERGQTCQYVETVAHAGLAPWKEKPGARNARLSEVFNGTPGRIRTCDFLLRRQALYPLSYGRSTPLIIA